MLINLWAINKRRFACKTGFVAFEKMPFNRIELNWVSQDEVWTLQRYKTISSFGEV